MSKESEILRDQAAVLIDVADSLEGKELAEQTMQEARDSAISARDKLRDAIAEAEQASITHNQSNKK